MQEKVINKIDYTKITPMMRQYVDLKREYKDSILIFRLGDFYEMFLDDAILVSKELDLILTGKSAGLEERIPMCGFPYHVADGYIKRLVNRGYKVAICDQLEDPKQSKGLVKRGITRLVTPGTNLNFDDENSDSEYLASIYLGEKSFSLSYVDFSTGDLYMFKKTENYSDINSFLKNQLSLLPIKEVIINTEDENILDFLKKSGILINLSESIENPEKLLNIISSLNFENAGKDEILSSPICKNSLIQLLNYIDKTQFGKFEHIRKLIYLNFDEFLILDKHTLLSLDIFSDDNLEKKGTLYNLLNKTKTAMGRRKLRYFLEHPLKNEIKINKRLNVVEALLSDFSKLSQLREYLNGIYDVEKTLVKLSGIRNSPKDLLRLKKSFENLPQIYDLLKSYDNKDINEYLKDYNDQRELYKLINSSIKEDAPLSSKEGNIIKKGYDINLDSLKNNSIDSKSWILNYESELKENTGINNLKIKYNKILGYFIEVTKSNLDKVPDYFIRKQTLVGSERYFTEDLKNSEMHIINSNDKINSFEEEIYESIKSEILKNYDSIVKSADLIAIIDVFHSFAISAFENEYTKPMISKDSIINIKSGRHPIVEKSVEQFIDNDTYIDNEHNFIILTGPNMAGKSTYMRQVALISLMTQIGSFVPCKTCELPIFDRIFTRIGAHDNLYAGESTFMVEMKEMADIVDNATNKSLLILDEVGRGTSTYDGLSIARALIEYIIDKINAKTIFATHYHELTDLSEKNPKIKNQTMEVVEKNSEIVFLRKVIDGKSDKSYGIHVASLAGIKNSIIKKADFYLNVYEKSDIRPKQLEFINVEENQKIENSSKYDDLISYLNKIDINKTTPIQAINKLDEIKEILTEIEKD